MRPGSGPRKTRRDSEGLRRVVPIPAPPEDYSDHEKRVWRQLAAQIDPLQLFTGADAGAFANWVRVQGLLERAISGESVDVDREGGARRASLGSIATLARTSSMYASQFKANPLARGAVPSPVEPDRGEGERDPDDIRPISLRVLRPPPSAS